MLEGVRRQELHYTSFNVSIHSPMISPRRPTDINDEWNNLHTPFSTPILHLPVRLNEIHTPSPSCFLTRFSFIFSNLRVQPPCLTTNIYDLRDPHLCTLLFFKRLGNDANIFNYLQQTITFLTRRVWNWNYASAMLRRVFWRWWTFDDVEGAYLKNGWWTMMDWMLKALMMVNEVHEICVWRYIFMADVVIYSCVLIHIFRFVMSLCDSTLSLSLNI